MAIFFIKTFLNMCCNIVLTVCFWNVSVYSNDMCFNLIVSKISIWGHLCRIGFYFRFDLSFLIYVTTAANAEKCWIKDTGLNFALLHAVLLLNSWFMVLWKNNYLLQNNINNIKMNDNYIPRRYWLIESIVFYV